MLDPESMVAEQVIDKYIRVVMSLFRTNMDDLDEEFLTQLEGSLQLSKGMLLMSEMTERISKQYNMGAPPEFPWTEQGR